MRVTWIHKSWLLAGAVALAPRCVCDAAGITPIKTTLHSNGGRKV